MTLEETNAAVKEAVRRRMEARDAGKPHEQWYDEVPLKQDDEPIIPAPGAFLAGWAKERMDAERTRQLEHAEIQRLTGDGVLADQAVHPTSQKYFDLLDTLRDLHVSKSAGYGCPDGTDPLLNIRRGAEFVGIQAWQGAMVRLSDKVTRLAVFNRTGNLPHESVEDNLLDLASYSLLALLLYREERDGRA